MFGTEVRHDSIFGCFNYFRYRPSTKVIKRHRPVELIRPYHQIAKQVNLMMMAENMNKSDLGLIIFMGLLGTAARRKSMFFRGTNSIVQTNIKGNLWAIVFLTMGIFKAFKFVRCRIRGTLPNGLPTNTSETPIKYDFSSQILANSFWSQYFVMRLKSTF